MQTPKRFQCRHIFTDGHRCGSPTLLLEVPNPSQPDQTHENFCYYHHTTRRPQPRSQHAGEDPSKAAFDLPLPEDRSAIQSAIGEVLRRIAGNALDPRRAGLLLYGLQIASLNLPPHPRPQPIYEEDLAAEPVTAIVTHPIHGPIAPAAEIVRPPERRSIGESLMRELWPEEYPDYVPPVPAPAQEPALPAILPNLDAVAASDPGAPCLAFETWVPRRPTLQPPQRQPGKRDTHRQPARPSLRFYRSVVDIHSTAPLSLAIEGREC